MKRAGKVPNNEMPRRNGFFTFLLLFLFLVTRNEEEIKDERYSRGGIARLKKKKRAGKSES